VKIIDHRRLKGTIYYRVRWENYGPKDDTWQPKDSLNCNDLLKEYHDELNAAILKREEAKLEAQRKAKSSNNEYEVEAIIASKTIKGRTKYRIRWKGWEEADDTWQFEEELNCLDLIRAFNKKGAKATPKKAAKLKSKKRKRDDSDSEADDSDDSDYGSPSKRTAGEYEVQKVLNARINKQNKWDFFVMWKGWGPEHNTWEPESNLNCPKLINEVSYRCQTLPSATNLLSLLPVPRKRQGSTHDSG
jgi:Chromo (CHRromatin Organisation MOdifier) domain